MGLEQRKSNGEQDSSRKTRNAKQIILIASLAVVILAALAVTGMHFTSQPNFCKTCHEISPQVTSWSMGPHKSVTCLECHANPGTIGYVTRKIKGLNEVYLHVTGQIPSPIQAKFNMQTCIVCHTGKVSGYPTAKNILLTSGDLAPKMPHASIISGNISCLTCHQNMGHAATGQQKVSLNN